MRASVPVEAPPDQALVPKLFDPLLLELSGAWPIIPCRRKRPLVPWRNAKPDPQRVLECPEADAWAVKLGGGLICVDIEGPQGWRWLDERGGLLQQVPTAWHPTFAPSATHIYYTLLPEIAERLPNKIPIADESGNIVLEIIVRGLALIPPSVVDGRLYEWRIAPNPRGNSCYRRPRKRVPLKIWPIPEPPEWFLRFLASIAEGGDQNQVLVQPCGGHRPPTLWDALRRDPRVLRYVCELMGLSDIRMGKAFRCRFHKPDHNPSAQFWLGNDGEPLYVDFHLGIGRRTFDLAEVFAALHTGELRPLYGKAHLETWGQLGRETGVLQDLTERAIRAHDARLATLVPQRSIQLSPMGNSCITSAQQAVEAGVVLRLWALLCAWFREAATKGQLAVPASFRYLAAHAGCSPMRAWEGMRVLQNLGVVVQVQDYARPGSRARGSQWALAWPYDPNDPTGFGALEAGAEAGPGTQEVFRVDGS